MKKVNLAQIAREAKVSIALVSQVLNNKEVRVTEKTRNRIVATAKELNYVPNRMAAGLRSNKTNILGCLVPDFNTPFYGKLVNALVSSANNNGYECMLFNTFDDVERQRKFLRLFASGLFDGMIIVPCDKSKNLDLYESMKASQFPHLFLYRNIPNIETMCVCEDGFASAYKATIAYIKHGHKKIAFISPKEYANVSLVIQRKSGYMKAVKENGLPPIEYVAKDDVESTDSLFVDLSQKDHCTACIISSSRNVHYVLSCLSRHGMHTPEDIELDVYGEFTLPFSSSEDIEIASTITKAPTIIELNPEDIAKEAVEILLNNIEKKQVRVEV